MKINKEKRSKNHDERPEGTPIDMVIIHAMALSIDDALTLLCNESPTEHGPVSAHYVIDHDGTIYELVSPFKRAWHAGISQWDGRSGLNAYSIGIELLNKDLCGGEKFECDFEDAQIDALISLIEKLKQEFPIKNEYILGHDAIAPDRKNDPGPRFPWKRVRQKLSC